LRCESIDGHRKLGIDGELLAKHHVDFKRKNIASKNSEKDEPVIH